MGLIWQLPALNYLRQILKVTVELSNVDFTLIQWNKTFISVLEMKDSGLTTYFLLSATLLIWWA